MEDFNDDTEQPILESDDAAETAEATNNEGGGASPKPEAETIVHGKMPRWTEEETTFLADQKAKGKTRKECIAAYFETFGDRRSPASVALKVPTTSRASQGPTRPANYPKPTRNGAARAPVVIVVKEPDPAPEVHSEPTLTPFMQSMTHFMEAFATASKAMAAARGTLKGKDLDTYQSVTKHYLMTLVP